MFHFQSLEQPSHKYYYTIHIQEWYCMTWDYDNDTLHKKVTNYYNLFYMYDSPSHQYFKDEQIQKKRIYQ